MSSTGIAEKLMRMQANPSQAALGLGAVSLVGAAAYVAFAGKKSPVHRRGGIIVTGASTGIGRHVAETLAGRGFIVFAGVRRAADAEKLKKACPSLEPVMLDVTSQDSIDKAMEVIASRLSELDLTLVALVNNAGVPSYSSGEFTDIDEAQATFDVNVFGCMRMFKACMPMLRATGPGARIINISSMAGFIATPGFGVYAGTKHALQAMSDALRSELHQFGIWVCTINPGFVKTEIIHKSHETSDESDEERSLYPMVSRYRQCMMSDISNGASPDVTSRAIVHAISSPRPWTRYLVANVVYGLPAWLAAYVAWYAPKQWNDAAVLMLVKLKCKFMSAK